MAAGDMLVSMTEKPDVGKEGRNNTLKNPSQPSMMRPLGKKHSPAGKLANRARQELGLDEIVAVGLENGFMGFRGVHDQDLLVSEAEVADEWYLGPFVGPLDLELAVRGCFEHGHELPDEKGAILWAWENSEGGNEVRVDEDPVELQQSILDGEDGEKGNDQSTGLLVDEPCYLLGPVEAQELSC